MPCSLRCLRASFQHKRDSESFQAASHSHGRVFSWCLESCVSRERGGNASPGP